MPGHDIGHDHVFLQNGFSHARLADNIDMLSPIIGFNAKTPALIPEIGFSEQSYLIFMVMIVIDGHILDLRQIIRRFNRFGFTLF